MGSGGGQAVDEDVGGAFDDLAGIAGEGREAADQFAKAGPERRTGPDELILLGK
ncbi:hypothetical protein Pssp01_41130 [Pseudomonas sp. NBRC 100443]|nr:hypothetical protein Pssp01_41130 [Pseudomonas sp. NBRC 100443]